MMAEIGETGARYQADIAGADHRDTHSKLLGFGWLAIAAAADPAKRPSISASILPEKSL
jgi:hypothetical protein